jgi:uncharacterized membrane protein (UPF0127 family)
MNMAAKRMAIGGVRGVAALMVLMLVSGCEGQTSALPPSATAPAPPDDMKFETTEMTIKERKFTIEIADSEAKIQRGLMFRKQMDADHGMLFLMGYSDYHSFWMKNTLIPLDIIYIDADGKVVDIHDRKPLDETGKGPMKPAKFVLELNAGRAKAIGLKVGDTVAIPEKYLKGKAGTSDK